MNWNNRVSVWKQRQDDGLPASQQEAKAMSDSRLYARVVFGWLCIILKLQIMAEFTVIFIL